MKFSVKIALLLLVIVPLEACIGITSEHSECIYIGSRVFERSSAPVFGVRGEGLAPVVSRNVGCSSESFAANDDVRVWVSEEESGGQSGHELVTVSRVGAEEITVTVTAADLEALRDDVDYFVWIRLPGGYSTNLGTVRIVNGGKTTDVATESDEDTATEDTATEDTATEDTAIEDTATEDTATEDTATEDTATEDTATEDTATEDTATEDTATSDTATGDTAIEDSEMEDTETGESVGRNTCEQAGRPMQCYEACWPCAVGNPCAHLQHDCNLQSGCSEKRDCITEHCGWAESAFEYQQCDLNFCGAWSLSDEAAAAFLALRECVMCQVCSKSCEPNMFDSACVPADTVAAEQRLVAAWDFTSHDDDAGVILENAAHREEENLYFSPGTEIDFSEGMGTMSVVERGASVLTNGPATALIDALQQSNRFTVDLIVHTTDNEQAERDRPARIFSIGGGVAEHFDLMIDQGANDLWVRFTTSQSGDSHYQEEVFDVFDNPDSVRVTVSFDSAPEGLKNAPNFRVYVNGELKVAKTVNGDLSEWHPMPLVLVQEDAGELTWTGTYYHVAIYNDVFTPEDLLLEF